MKNWRKWVCAVVFAIIVMAILVEVEVECKVYPGLHFVVFLINCIISLLFGGFGYLLGSVIDEEEEFKRTKRAKN